MNILNIFNKKDYNENCYNNITVLNPSVTKLYIVFYGEDFLNHFFQVFIIIPCNNCINNKTRHYENCEECKQIFEDHINYGEYENYDFNKITYDYDEIIIWIKDYYDLEKKFTSFHNDHFENNHDNEISIDRSNHPFKDNDFSNGVNQLGYILNNKIKQVLYDNFYEFITYVYKKRPCNLVLISRGIYNNQLYNKKIRDALMMILNNYNYDIKLYKDDKFNEKSKDNKKINFNKKYINESELLKDLDTEKISFNKI